VLSVVRSVVLSVLLSVVRSVVRSVVLRVVLSMRDVLACYRLERRRYRREELAGAKRSRVACVGSLSLVASVFCWAPSGRFVVCLARMLSEDA
jgi:hypothetical protein